MVRAYYLCSARHTARATQPGRGVPRGQPPPEVLYGSATLCLCTDCRTTETTCRTDFTGLYRWHAMHRKKSNWACDAHSRGVRIMIVMSPTAQCTLHTSYGSIGARAARITPCGVRVAGLSRGTVFTTGTIDGLSAGFTSMAHTALKAPIEFTSSRP